MEFFIFREKHELGEVKTMRTFFSYSLLLLSLFFCVHVHQHSNGALIDPHPILLSLFVCFPSMPVILLKMLHSIIPYNLTKQNLHKLNFPVAGIFQEGNDNKAFGHSPFAVIECMKTGKQSHHSH